MAIVWDHGEHPNQPLPYWKIGTWQIHRKNSCYDTMLEQKPLIEHASSLQFADVFRVVQRQTRLRLWESWEDFGPTFFVSARFDSSPWKTDPVESGFKMIFWLVVSTHLKNMSQIGSFPQGSGWKFQKCLKFHHLVFIQHSKLNKWGHCISDISEIRPGLPTYPLSWSQN